MSRGLLIVARRPRRREGRLRRRGDDRTYHYGVALGSAREAATAIALLLAAAGAVPPNSAGEALPALDRTIALCYRLVHPRR